MNKKDKEFLDDGAILDGFDMSRIITDYIG